MALIINQEPSEYSPAFNQQPFVVRETDVTDSNLSDWRMLCAVLRNGDLTQVVGVTKVRFRLGSGGRIVFDPQRLIESDLSHDHGQIDTTVTPWELCRNSMTNYTATFTSQYWDGTQWVGKGFTMTRMKWVYNGGIEVIEFPTYNQNDYIMSSGDVLTNAARSQTIGSNDSLWLHMIANQEETPKQMCVRTFDGAGSVLSTTYYDNPFDSFSGAVIVGSTIFQAPLEKRRRLRVAVGTRDLAALDTPVSFSGAASYTVNFYNGGGQQIGTVFTFTIDDCSKYQRYRLHFLNRLGGLDAFDFTLKSMVNREIKDKTFLRQYNTLSAGSYGYTSESFGTVTYDTEVNKSLILNSDIVTDTQAEWLEELATSPVIYLENTDGTFTAMSRTTKQYQIKRGQQDGVIYLQLELDYALNDIRQRG